MAPTRFVEIAVGLFVIGGVVALFFLAMQVSNLSALAARDGYTVTARFENVGGLKVRSPVTSAGVRIGRVVSIDFDAQTFEAIATLRIDDVYDKLPKDTAASIFTAGLLGEQYIGLQPGGAVEVLQEGDEIQLTQSALILEQIVGQFLFSKASEVP